MQHGEQRMPYLDDNILYQYAKVKHFEERFKFRFWADFLSQSYHMPCRWQKAEIFEMPLGK
jgi:hypothetical protein